MEDEADRSAGTPAAAEATVVAVPALLWSVAAAAVGALAWGWIIAEMEFEIGWLAWGIGAAIGAAFRKGGGRGTLGGVLCGLLALLSIVAGKYYGVSMILADVRTQTRAMVAMTLGSPEVLRDYHEAAKAWGEADKTDAGTRAFMVEHEFTDAASPEAVEAGEVTEFLSDSVPDFERYGHLEFEEFRQAIIDDQLRQIDEMEMSVTDAVVESLSPIDILFGLLGIATAFGLATGRQQAAVAEKPYRRGSRGRRIAPPPGGERDTKGRGGEDPRPEEFD